MGLFNAKRRAEARAVPGDTKYTSLNRNELAAATLVAQPHSARFDYRFGNRIGVRVSGERPGDS